MEYGLVIFMITTCSNFSEHRMRCMFANQVGCEDQLAMESDIFHCSESKSLHKRWSSCTLDATNAILEYQLQTADFEERF